MNVNIHLHGGFESEIPRDLERYLPSYLWLKLSEQPSARGVLLNVLDRLRSTFYLLSTFLPAHLVQARTLDPVAGVAEGRRLTGALLFADISGFTALSERLAAQGPQAAEIWIEIINSYFGRMLDIIARSGGILIKFAGDAFLVYFPEQAGSLHCAGGGPAAWAVRAACRMQHAMKDFDAVATSLGPLALKMKVGVSSGPFWSASIGSTERMEYLVLGGAVTRTMYAESVAQPGQVIVDQNTAASIESLEPKFECDALDQAPGFYAIHDPLSRVLDDFEIKAELSPRARLMIPLSAEPAEIGAEIEAMLSRVRALAPYLPPELVDRIVTGAPQRRLESEYRSTVVLFVNFIGVEALLAAWNICDPDNRPSDEQERGQAVTHLLNDYFNAMHRVIAGYRGVISRVDSYVQGSRLLVLFGAPVAREDDVRRAIQAALSMQSELKALNRRGKAALAGWLSPDFDGALIQQRIGITRGVTFAGQVGAATRREYTVMGDEVNLAARLMSAAQPGEILVSQNVYDAVPDRFCVASLPPIRVKGKSKPVPVYRVEGVREDYLARRLRQAGALIGREAELEQALALARRALAGQGACLSICGEAGVGKSRLADAIIVAMLARGARAFLCECAAHTAESPCAAWILLVQAMAGIGSTDLPETRGDKLLRLLAETGAATDDYKAPLFHLLGLPITAAPAWRLTEARVAPTPDSSLFERIGQHMTDQAGQRWNVWELAGERRSTQSGQLWRRLHSRVISKEQAQLFEAVCGLIERMAARAPLVIVFENAQWMDTASCEWLSELTRRASTWPVLILRVGRQMQDMAALSLTITPGPLSLRETSALVAHLMPESELPAGWLQAIYEHSGGNPLFVHEIVCWLQQNRLAAETLPDVLRSSDTLRKLVLSRVDSLAPGQRTVIKAASIAGNDFYAHDVVALLDQPEEIDVRGSLAELEVAQMIWLLEAAPADRYAFCRPLVRDMIYDGQTFRRRRELHARLAACLEARYARNLTEYAELLAYHYERAQRWLAAAGFLVMAARKAQQRYAYPEAGRYYRRALEMLEQLETGEMSAEVIDLRSRAWEGQGDVALLMGDFASAIAAYRAAAQDNACARLWLKQALVLPAQGQADESRALAQQVWDTSPGEAATRLAAAAMLAWLLWREGAGEFRAWVERAVALLPAESDRWTAGVAALLADLSDNLQAAFRAYLALEQPVGAALAVCRLGDWHLQRGEAAEAMALYEQAADLWRSEDDEVGLALALYKQARACLPDTETACAKLKEALNLIETRPERCLVQAAWESQPGSEPGALWQNYRDAFYIRLLFRL